MTQIDHIFFLLDNSGSMESCRDETIKGFNDFIDKQKELKIPCYLSFYQFNNSISIIFENKDINEVTCLTEKSFIPKGSTALLDGIGFVISRARSNTVFRKRIIVILTDGHENCSREYARGQIKELIEKTKTAENIEYIFLAANQDAITSAATLGINRDQALTFNIRQSREAHTTLAHAIVTSRSTGEKTHFVESERQIT